MDRARQDWTPRHAVGLSLLSKHTSTALRELSGQLTAKLERGKLGLSARNWLRRTSGSIWPGGVPDLAKVAGISNDWNAVRTSLKYSSGFRPEQEP